MRLWTIHPKYLDSKGLVALWRETLLAQNVLLGKTKGYKNHPQLIRFKKMDKPLELIASYLLGIFEESKKRNYNFDKTKIVTQTCSLQISVTSGQIIYEKEHLLNKLKVRDENLYHRLNNVDKIDLHPIFYEIQGSVESWEVVA